MINLKQELISYPPIDIDSLMKKEPSLADNIVNSILLYNKALENIRLNSEDIAIIELKKAISMNSNFHEAMNLLGICYMCTKDYPKAAEIFEKVASMEKNGVKAQNYMSLLNNGEVQIPESDNKKGVLSNTIGKQTIPKVKNAFKNVSTHMDIENEGQNRNYGLFKLAIGFAAGVIVMILFMFLFKPIVKNNVDVSSKYNSENNTQNDTINSLEQKVKELTENNKSLENQLQNSNSELDYYKSISKLSEAESFSNARKYEAAADILVMLKTIQFKDSEKNRYDNLYNNVIPKAAWAVYNDGNNLMRYKKYKEALDKLSKVQVYGSDWNYLDATYYKMGTCYKELNEPKNALEMFQKLIAKYPKSQYTQYANYRIAELKGAS